MEHLSSDMEQQNQHQEQQQLQWRRDKYKSFAAKDTAKEEVSQTLQVGLVTVNRDTSYLKNQAKANIKKYIDQKMIKPNQENLLYLLLI